MVLGQFSISIRSVFVTAAIAGNGFLASAANAQVLTPSDAFIAAPHATFEGGVFTGDTLAAAFSILTNGTINHGGGGPLQDNVDTWMHDNFGRNHFVGLKYSAANRFDSITVELGNQFGDGGDWAAMPKLYILKNPTLVGGTVRPEYLPSTIWTEVTGHVETTGHVFNPIVTPGAGGTITFNLSAIPAAARTGWGWALGGVPGNHDAGGLWNFLSLTEASATGAAATAPAIVTPATPQPVNIVSNAYHVPVINGDGYTDIRGAAFEVITNGVVDHGGGGHADGYDTFQGDTEGASDFVGLQYNTKVKFDSITIELGNQFGDGGDWDSEPRIFILKNPVDTGSARPEDDPSNWTELLGAVETTGHVFSNVVVPGAGGTITFNLAGIDAADRTGWGWAVGGVDGNGRGSDGLYNFLSITDVSITGSVISAAHPGDFDGDGDVDGADFVAWQTNFPTATGATLAQGDADGDGDVDGADFVVWQTNFPFTPGPGASPVPEPGAGFLAALAVAAAFAQAKRRT